MTSDEHGVNGGTITTMRTSEGIPLYCFELIENETQLAEAVQVYSGFTGTEILLDETENHKGFRRWVWTVTCANGYKFEAAVEMHPIEEGHPAYWSRVFKRLTVEYEGKLGLMSPHTTITYPKKQETKPAMRTLKPLYTMELNND